MNTPFKKRTNPLALDEQKPVETKQEQEEVVEEVVQPVPQTKPQPKKQPKEVASVKEKYTAVMDRQLRRRVKVASINLGLDYSSFIEQAVREKLERAGY